MRNSLLLIGISVLSLTTTLTSSCDGGQAPVSNDEADSLTLRDLQGIWVDDESENVQFRIKGDTIYYPDAEYNPLGLRVMNDTLYLYGSNDTTSYKIDRHEGDAFWFHSLSDEIVKLHRSENELDSIAFEQKEPEDPMADQVVKRDSVMMYNGHRYRGYVYVNPSKRTVTKTTYTEMGMSVENVYYDNSAYICVYEGKKRLFGRNFTKDDFTETLSADFLRQAILSDMNFIKVTAAGYIFEATLCIPEEAACYDVDITVSPEGLVSMTRSSFL